MRANNRRIHYGGKVTIPTHLLLYIKMELESKPYQPYDK